MIMQFMKYVVRNEIGLCAQDEMHVTDEIYIVLTTGQCCNGDGY